MRTQFNCQKTFLFQTIQFIKTVIYITIQFSVSTVSISKTIPFQTIQFSIGTQFKCKYGFSLAKARSINVSTV